MFVATCKLCGLLWTAVNGNQFLGKLVCFYFNIVHCSQAVLEYLIVISVTFPGTTQL